MSARIPFGPVAPSAKPVFDPPDDWKYRVDGVQMELSWRPDFGAEKTAALQKAQNDRHHLPRLDGRKEALRVSVTSSGYIVTASAGSCKMQMQLRLEYYQPKG